MAQQKQIKQYGSLQAAQAARQQTSQVAQAEQTNLAQQKLIQEKIAKQKLIIAENTWGTPEFRFQKRDWDDRQIRIKEAQREIAEYNKVAQTLKSGASYENIEQVAKSIADYGHAMRSYDRKKKERRADWREAKERAEAQLQEISEVAPSTISYTGGKTAAPVIKPGQPVYYELGESGKPVGDVVYTAPETTGRAIPAETLRPRSDLVKPGEPIYAPLKNIEAEGGFTPGEQPFRYTPGPDANRFIIGAQAPTPQETQFLRDQSYSNVGIKAPLTDIRTPVKDRGYDYGQGTMTIIPDSVEFDDPREVKEQNVVIAGQNYYTNIQPTFGSTDITYDLKNVERGQQVMLTPGELPEPTSLGGHLISGLKFTGAAAAGAGIVYKDKVIPWVAEVPLIDRVGKYIVRPTVKYGIIPAYEGTRTGLEFYQEKVVRPISEEGLPVGGVITQQMYKAVTGQKKTAPLGQENPIADIADASRYVAGLDPDTMVTIGRGEAAQQVRAGDLSKKGLIGFGEEVLTKQVEAGFTLFSKDYSREIFGSEVSQETAEMIGKGASVVTRYSPYAIPGYYETKVGAQLAEAQLLEGEYGGAESALEYTKDNPVEVALAAGMIYAKGVSVAAKSIVKTDAAKYEKYLTSRKIEADSVKRVVEQKVTKIPKTSEKLFFPEGTKKIITKGGTTIKYSVPTNKFSGKAYEVVQIVDKAGRVKEITLTSKLNVVIKDSGRVIRTFKYSDGTTKIVTTYGNKITTKLVSPTGKKLFEKSVTSKGFVDKMVQQKIKKVKLSYKDTNIKDYASIVKITEKGGQKKLMLITREGVVRKIPIKSKEADFILKELVKKSGTKAKAGGTGIQEIGKSKTGGEIIQTKETFVDIIKASDVRRTAGESIGRVDTFTSSTFQKGKQPTKVFDYVRKAGKTTKSYTGARVSRDVSKEFSQNIFSYQVSPDFRGAARYIEPRAGTLGLSGSKRKFTEAFAEGVKKAKEVPASGIKAAKELPAKGDKLLQLVGGKTETVSRAISKATDKSIVYIDDALGLIPTQAKPILTPASIALKAVKETTIPAFGLSFSGFAAASLSAFSTTPKEATSEIQDIDLFTSQADETIQTDDTRSDTDTDTDIGQRTDTGTGTITIGTIVTIPEETIPVDIGDGQTPPPEPPPTTDPTPENGSRRFRFDLDIPGIRKEPSSNLVQAYQGQVLVKGKYKTVTEKPRSKKGALDVISRIIDNTTSAQGRVMPTKKKVQRKKIVGGDGYYNANRKKFRGFRIIKGKQTPVKDTIIEKRGFRSDSPGEKRGLTVAQFTSRARKRKAGLPVRKKKSRFRL